MVPNTTCHNELVVMRGGRDLDFRDKVDSQKRESGPKMENWELS